MSLTSVQRIYYDSLFPAAASLVVLERLPMVADLAREFCVVVAAMDADQDVGHINPTIFASGSDLVSVIVIVILIRDTRPRETPRRSWSCRAQRRDPTPRHPRPTRCSSCRRRTGTFRSACSRGGCHCRRHWSRPLRRPAGRPGRRSSRHCL